MPFVATRMDLEIIMLSEVSQTEKDKYMTWLICVIFKRAQMNLSTKERVIDAENKFMVVRGWGEWDTLGDWD